jgi:MOSC domain-containing protein YiiM
MSDDKQKIAWETPPERWLGLKASAGSWRGEIVSLFIAPNAAGPMVSLSQVRAFADRGLEGDRFFRESWNAANRPDKAVSLIEEETLRLAAAELGVEMIAEKTRRNIVTRGVPLIELLNREFTIGGVRLRGVRLFEPCAHVEQVSETPGLFRALEHRSGLKAAILTDGMIRVGDPVMPWPGTRAVATELV